MKHPLTDILDRVSRLDSGRMFFDLFNRADVQFEVNYLNTEVQLDNGQRSDGSFLPDYSEVSVEFYGKRSGAIRLYDTGAFWESFKEKSVSTSEYIWIADGDKEQDNLFVLYGDKVIGLTQESINELTKMLEPLIIQWLRDAIGSL